MQKQIYIKDSDLEIFKKAETLGGGNLSAVIAEALRRYVVVEEAKKQGIKEQEIEICCNNNIKKIRFLGKKIASGKLYPDQTNNQDKYTDCTLYLTRKGKLLLYKKRIFRQSGKAPSASYEIFNNLNEIREVPITLFKEAMEALEEATIEYLDV